jgi:hypothetical protein
MQFRAVTIDEYGKSAMENFSRLDRDPNSLNDEEKLLYAKMLLHGIRNHNVTNPIKGIEFLKRVATSTTSYAAQKLYFEILYYGFKTIKSDQKEAIRFLSQYVTPKSIMANMVSSVARYFASTEPEKSAIFCKIAADAEIVT